MKDRSRGVFLSFGNVENQARGSYPLPCLLFFFPQVHHVLEHIFFPHTPYKTNVAVVPVCGTHSPNTEGNACLAGQ